MAERLKSFRAKVYSVGPKGHWTCMKLPFSVDKEFGARGRLSVRGTLNGYKIRTSIFPDGKGTHFLLVNKQMQKGAGGIEPGDTIQVTLRPDPGPRSVAVPAALKKALGEKPRAKAAFQKLSYTHRKDYAAWVGGAKQAETRQRRANKAVELLNRGLTWQGWRDRAR